MSILVTGVTGFIGYHVAEALLSKGHDVVGIDNNNAYYSALLKQDRLGRLLKNKAFRFHPADITNGDAIEAALREDKIDQIIHLAAQAGVRYSIQNPATYAAANLKGHFNILDLALRLEVENFVYASSSSVYGGNTKIPFSEYDRTDDPVSFYGATKKSNELASHSYCRLHGLSATGLRFFTVYGPWGRPDMAYWMFAERILKGKSIRVFNQGDMSRDFTYIDDIVAGILSALERPAGQMGLEVPHRIYNLGNDRPEKLMDLIRFIESGLGREAQKSFEPMQQGDLQKTWADIGRARAELGFDPKVDLQTGIQRFCDWYKDRWERYLAP